MNRPGLGRGVVVFFAALLGAAVAGTALASPMVIYSRWVGDPGVDPRNPDGAFFQYCDFGAQGDPAVYSCVPNDKFGSDFNDDVTEFPNAVGGIGTLDLNGDGKLDFLALEGATSPAVAGSGEIGYDFPKRGSINILLPPASHTTGAGLPGIDPLKVVAFTVATVAPGTPGLIVAHTTDGTDLLVDIFNVNGTLRTMHPLSLALLGMNKVSRGADSDFLGLTADDDDGDGVAELMVLHTGSNPLLATVDTFKLDGTPWRTTQLTINPRKYDSLTSTLDETYVGGFAHLPIVDGGPREYVVLTVDHSLAPPERPASSNTQMKFTLWRFDASGTLFVAPQNLQSVPFFSGAIVLGIAELHNDNNCNGIDEDNDGVPDSGFVPKVVTCGLGICSKQADEKTPITAMSTCVKGVEVPAVCPAPVFQPAPEQLNALDDDCNGTVDDIPELPACGPNDTNWWCCPTGADLHFAVNTTADVNDEATAANGCFPQGFVPAGGATCSLRGVARRAEQLRGRANIRPVCRVVADLVGDYKLSRHYRSSYLNVGSGLLVLHGTGFSTIIEPADPTVLSRLVWEGLDGFMPDQQANPQSPPELTIQNLVMSNARVDNFGQGGGAAVGITSSIRGAKLTIEDSTFERFTANQEGAAIQFWTEGVLSVSRSVFRNNDNFTFAALGNAHGGAISSHTSVVRIEDSSFVYNASKFGGAVDLQSSTATLLNNTFFGNKASHAGGAIFAAGGSTVLRFNTIVANTLPDVDHIKRAGGGVSLSGTNVEAYGNIIAGNEWGQAPAEIATQAIDCSVTDATVVLGGFNLIGKGGRDCAGLGAPDGALIGSTEAPVNAQVDSIPAVAPPGGSLCPAGRVLAPCVPVCNGVDAAGCIASPKVLPPSPAIGRYSSGVLASGIQTDTTCPFEDQRHAMRPTDGPATHCTIGSVEPTAAVKTLSNGNMLLSIRIPGPAPAYIEPFMRDNGVQNVSGDIRSSQVANADGSFTYSKTISGSSYHSGDKIDYRFYYYRSGQQGVFQPGPSATVWYPATTYRQPTATPSASTCKQSNGSMKLALTLSTSQAYVEAFGQINGVQSIAGAITSSRVANMNGTLTYSRVVPASSFHTNDVVRGRFYHYESTAPGSGTFEPGPGEQVFYPSVVYGSAPACP